MINDRHPSPRRRKLGPVLRAVLLPIALSTLLLQAKPAMAKLQRAYRVWADITLDAQDWYSGVNYFSFTHLLQLGHDGFIKDPYLLGYELQAGLIDHQIQRDGIWSSDLGWNVGLRLNAFPASRFPLTAYFNHTTNGIDPETNPGRRVNDSTQAGGLATFKFPAWPTLNLTFDHLIQTTQTTASPILSPGVADPLADVTVRQTEGTMTLTRGDSSLHRWQVLLELRDRQDEQLDLTQQSLRFRGEDQLEIISGGLADASVEGYVDSINGQQRADYQARIGFLMHRIRKIQVNAFNLFQRSTYLGSALTVDQLVGELYYPVNKWLELFSGIALSYLDQSGLARDRIVREQLGTGVRVGRALLGGSIEGRYLIRVGETQVLDRGHGLMFAHELASSYTRPFATRTRFEMTASSILQYDWSPLATRFGAHVLRVGVSSDYYQSTFANLQGTLSRSSGESDPAGAANNSGVTESATSAGVQLDTRIMLIDWATLDTTITYSSFLAGDTNADSRLYAGTRLAILPNYQMFFYLEGWFDRRFREGQDDTTARLEAKLNLRLRQLLVTINYQYAVDDYRGISRGEHVALLRVSRRFDVTFGRAQ